MEGTVGLMETNESPVRCNKSPTRCDKSATARNESPTADGGKVDGEREGRKASGWVFFNK